MKKKSSFVLVFSGILICAILLALNFHQTSFATESSQQIRGFAAKNCSYYTAKKTSDTYRVGKLTFGDEVTVLTDDTATAGWSRVIIDSQEYYMLSENLDFYRYNSMKVGTSAYQKADGKLTRLGYMFYGEELEIVGYETIEGSKYAICKCPTIYKEADLLTVAAENVNCYIKNSSLEVSCVYKIANANTNVYQSADSTASKTALSFGTVVKEICHNDVWSKVDIDGKIGYVYSEKLDDYNLNVIQKTGKVRKSTYSTSSLVKTVYLGDSIQVIREYVTSSGSRYILGIVAGKKGLLSSSYVGAVNVLQTDTLTNLYAEPTTESKVVASIPVNQELIIEHQGENWAATDYNGQRVFVQMSKVKDVKKLASGNAAGSLKDLINANYSVYLQNADVRLLAVNYDAGYAKIENADGSTLWIKSKYLRDNTKLMMVSVSSCKIYSKPDSASANILGQLTLGDEVKEYERQDLWSVVQVNGQTGFVYTSNLKDKKLYVAKSYVAVVNQNLETIGYIPFGSECNLIEKATLSSNSYYRCIIPVLYETSTGTKVVGNKVEGYVRTTSLSDVSTVKVVKTNTNLYASPSSTAQTKPILTSDEVAVCCSNATWSKVKYNGEYFYVYNSKLEDKKLSPSVKSVKLYTMMNSSSPRLQYVYWNTPVVVHGTYKLSSGTEYAYCTYKDYAGYIILTSSSGTKNLESNDVRYVNCNSNVYAEPNLNTVLTETHVDTKVCLLYQGENWSKILVDGQTGFIQNEKLDMKLYAANGSLYSTAYRLYKDNPSDTAEDKMVSLAAINEKYHYAMVSTGTGKNVWISSDSLLDANSGEIMYTVKHSTTLREKAVTEGQEIVLPYMTKLTYFGKATESEQGSWLRVLHGDRVLYMWEPAGENFLTSRKSTFTYESKNNIQRQVIDLACEIVNEWKTKYVRGDDAGRLDEDGYYCFDCSGFTSYVLNTVMRQYVPTYRLAPQSEIQSHTTDLFNMDTEQSFCAKDVKFEELAAGDVILFDMKDETGEYGHDGTVDHAGLYLGNNEFAHSSKYFDASVQIMPLDDIFMESIVNIKRFLPTPSEIQPIENLTLYTFKGTNVYSEASSESEPLAKLLADQPVKVLYTSAYWVYGEYETGKYGFVYKDNLKEPENDETRTMYMMSMSKKLYKEASTESNYITVYIGAELLYKGQVGSTNYYKVEYQGDEYYLFSKEGIDNLLAESLDTVLYDQGEYMVNGNTNFRATPDSSSDANLLGQMKAGSVVKLYAVSESWVCVVRADGARGFISPTKITRLSEIHRAGVTKYIKETSKKIYSIADTATDYRTYYVGQVITFYGRVGTTNYYYVSVEGVRGFLYCEENINDILSDAYISCEKTILTTSNFRSAPDSSSEANIIGSLKRDTKVTVMYEGNTWAYVYDPISKQYGYVTVNKLQ